MIMKLKIILLLSYSIVTQSVFYNDGTVLASNESSTTINLYSSALEAKEKAQAIMLYFSATYCTFCMQLSEDVIQAIKINEGYIKKVRVIEISLDAEEDITDFDNHVVDVDVLQSRYNIQVTPTLLFVDQKGDEVTERIVGYQSKDFYWYYLDEAINKSQLTK